MRDLTTGSIVGHIGAIATPILAGMFAQIVYQLVDLYFVAKIGVTALAGVSAAGNTILVVTAIAQVLAAGTASTIAYAVGRKERAAANLIFNQVLALSTLCGIAMMLLLWALAPQYLWSVAAGAEAREAGIAFLSWVLPGFALMLPTAVISAALRGTGVTYISMAAYLLTVGINALLCPTLILGWGTGKSLGVAGAGLATSLSVAIGVALLATYTRRSGSYLRIDLQLLRPRLDQWRRILAIGLPAGGDFAFMFLSTTIVYSVIQNFGVTAQAGFGVGSRVLQAILLPGMAIAFAAGPLIGQNYGASKLDRVRQTFRLTAVITTAVMISITALVMTWSAPLTSVFADDPAALTIARQFLEMASWALVAQGLVYVCAYTFQGLGDAKPALISSMLRFVMFAASAVSLSTCCALRLEQVWYLWIGSAVLQAAVSLLLLRAQFRMRLTSPTHASTDTRYAREAS